MRYLFGPVDRNFADQNLADVRRASDCLAFGLVRSSAAGADPPDLHCLPDESWDAFAKRFPDGWRPDCIFLHLQYQAIPPALWEAPIPIVGIAGDWNLLWHGYRSLRNHCDAIVVDAAGVPLLERDGFPGAVSGLLYGAEQRHFRADADGERDIDVLFVGNFHPAIHGRRLRRLRLVAEALPDRNVRFAAGVVGDDYVRLMRRARIAFNGSVRGEWNLRCGEALAAGALLFVEADNREVSSHLQPGVEYVAYDDANLAALLRRYLEDEQTREAVAARGRARAPEFSFAAQWRGIVERIASSLPKPRPRTPLDPVARTWACLSASSSDPLLHRDLANRLEAHPQSSLTWHLRASLWAWQLRRPEDYGAVAEAYQRAWKADPRNVLAGLGLAETLWRMRRKADTIAQAERVLNILAAEDVDPYLDLPPYPTRFDRLRCEWERVAWFHAGDRRSEREDKKRLLRWRLQHLAAEAASDPIRAFAAVAERPDLPETRLTLGQLLLGQGRAAEAADHLREAWEQNPFHAQAASLAYQACLRAGQTDSHLRIAATWRCLAKGAPGIVPLEPWAQNADLLPLPSTEAPARTFSVAWEGAFDGVASLALVNRRLCGTLRARGHRIVPVPTRNADGSAPRVPDDWAAAIAPSDGAPIEVHVAHQWPPRFERPKAGKWVLMQPWEFGSIPKDWVEPIRRDVDEVWVPSRFVRNCFVNDGIPPEKIHVVPNGIGPAIVGDRPYPLKTAKRFKFLFVGGAIRRKGIDLLLAAYGQCFDASDDVCLVVKEMGGRSFYRGQTAEASIDAFLRRPGAPEIERIDEDLSEAAMASLYAACDCLVHPFRGEGFGLPILEAMANGLPAIVTGFGPVLDYCTPETTYLLPATAHPLPERKIGDLETVRTPFLAEPDPDALRATLRRVVDRPDEARAKGEAARKLAFERFTWDRAADAVEARLAELTAKAPLKENRPKAPEPKEALGPGSVSLCLIVRNEEANLGPCLESVRGLADEIVVVDTGSADRTRDIARACGARVFEFPWIDDFAAARNETLRHARGDWILWMDADDRLDAANQAKLRSLLGQLDGSAMGYVMQCRCLPDHDTGAVTVVDHIRLFRRLPELRWTYRIHEQILPGIRRLGGEVAWSDVVVDHVGYQDRALRGRKLQRDLRLLELENQDRPNDPFTLFNLGSAYLELGRAQDALDAFRRSLRGSHPTDSIVRKLYSLIAQCERRLGRHAASLDACREGRGHYPSDPEILFQEGLARTALGDLPGAEACYRAATEPPTDRHFGSIDPGIRGYKARHNLAVVCRDQGKFEEAESQWRLALAEAPDFVPGWNGLADLLIERGRRAEAQELLDEMPTDARFAETRRRLEERLAPKT